VSAGTRVTAVLDAYALSPASRGTGLGTYVRALLAALGRRSDVVVRALATAEADVPPGVERVEVRRRLQHGRPAFLEHAVRRDLESRRVRADVFHNPAPDASVSPPHPYVQTLLDLIPLTDPDPALAVMKKRFLRYARRYRAAEAVIAISRHTADEGIARFGLDPRRLHVIHLGVDEAFTPEGPSLDTGVPYVVMVSEFSRRKGFAEAYATIGALADAGYPHRLVVGGRVQPWQRQLFDDLLGAAPNRDRIEVRGFVADLPALYRGADACIVPSRSEGFGLSALEAMACGTPVVAFDNSALPEVIDSGGILVPDGDVGAMVAGIRSVLDHGEVRSELRERALARARTFTWDRCAREHTEVYAALAPG
jgi:glycosyltransferase involved in cell wall biosynthesis